MVSEYHKDLLDVIHQYNIDQINNHYPKGNFIHYYDDLPKFETAVFKFWVWPLSKFGTLETILEKKYGKKKVGLTIVR